LVRACVLLAGLAALSGCWSPRIRPLPAEALATLGTATFEGSHETIYAACIAALRASGYSIAHEDRAAGMVFTATLPARTFPAAREGDILLRRYEIQVTEAAGGSAQVTATPMLYDGRRARGDTRVARARAFETAWTLAEEEAEWKRLFGAIRHELDVAATAHGHPVVPAASMP
jgi:hypothetical protein